MPQNLTDNQIDQRVIIHSVFARKQFFSSKLISLLRAVHSKVASKKTTNKLTVAKRYLTRQPHQQTGLGTSPSARYE